MNKAIRTAVYFAFFLALIQMAWCGGINIQINGTNYNIKAGGR